MPESLSATEREAAMVSLESWTYDTEGDAISRNFKFRDFSEAFGFMTRVALLAEAAGHHPNWTNVYDTVSVRLSTHDAGGLSQKDIDLAGRIDALLD